MLYLAIFPTSVDKCTKSPNEIPDRIPIQRLDKLRPYKHFTRPLQFICLLNANLYTRKNICL